MSLPDKPRALPQRPYFSSGPCPKRPGWSATEIAERAFLGRSHRAADPKAQIKAVIDTTAEILNVPPGYKVGIVPASDTGAVELALWSMLGARPVDVLVWESFSAGWATDIEKHLKLDDVIVHKADYGALPDLSKVRRDSDIVFAWNGTTSGVRVPNADWIAADRQGLTICDATSAAFAQDLDWDKLDVVTFSWQKAMGGEGAHGVVILSPRAVERLEDFTPDRPLPKIFRLTKGGTLNASIFAGATINTPSMLCIADAADALDWIKGLGGAAAMQARADANAAAVQAWVDQRDWIENLAADPATRSNTSVCLSITAPEVATLAEADQRAFIKAMAAILEAEGAAFDIAGYRDAPPGLRIWCGATVDTADVVALTGWLDWAFEATRSAQAAA